MAVVDPVGLLVELHVQLRITFVETCGYAVVDMADGLVDRLVLDTQIICVAECQEGAETQSRRRVGFQKCILDEDTVFMRDEYLLLVEHHATYAKSHRRDFLTVELAYIFMAVRAEHVALILMKPEIERGSMLYYRLIERREQYVGLVIHLRDGNHKQTMLLAGVASHDGSAMIGPRFVGAEHLLRQRLLQINH